MSPQLRRKVWRSTVSQCAAMAEDLNTVLDQEQMAARIEPL
jgi:flagellar biosynthesis/type III secretory pathway chaperone